MIQLVEQLFGVVLFAFVLIDVFVTVLYARMGTGLISRVLGLCTWGAFLKLSGHFVHDRGIILSFCGPAILVLLVVTWAVLAACGAAFIMHPEMGSGIQASNGKTPSDFVTALYVGGSSLSIIGASNFSPQTGPMRLLFLFNSIAGTSVISLTLTYVLQVYTALKQHNALGLAIETLSAGTGDAAELVARIGPRGQFSAGYTNIAEVAQQIVEAKESHHLYPVLFYFRFREPFYSVSRISFIALDAVALIQTALDDEQHGWLKDSASVQQLRLASLMLLTSLETTFLGRQAHRGDAALAQAPMTECWRKRYEDAEVRISAAMIETVPDSEAAAGSYIRARSEWDAHVRNVAAGMGYTVSEIDPVSGRLIQP